MIKYTISSLQGNSSLNHLFLKEFVNAVHLVKHTNPTLQPNFAREPFCPSLHKEKLIDKCTASD